MTDERLQRDGYVLPTNDRAGSWMQTYSGGQIWPLDPRPEEIKLVDIAHALSQMCRFGGHSDVFYSVAEHCIHVERRVLEVTKDYLKALAALFHDGTEAYLIDIPRPIKPFLTNYYEIEAKLEATMSKIFSYPYPYPPEIKDADNLVLACEARDIMKPPPLRLESSFSRSRLYKNMGIVSIRRRKGFSCRIRQTEEAITS